MIARRENSLQTDIFNKDCLIHKFPAPPPSPHFFFIPRNREPSLTKKARCKQ